MPDDQTVSPPSLIIAGEEVQLLTERALFWQRTATLIIADPHIGKASAFRAAAVAVPEDTTHADLDRLSRLIARCNAQKVVILGDLLHARSGRTTATLAAVSAWRARHASLDLILVRGNHDVRAGDPPSAWDIACLDEPWQMPPFILRHHPAAHPDGYALAGHLHPAARLIGAGRQRATLPCFWFGAQVGVLPAFGSFTGATLIAPERDDQVFVIAGDDVVAVSGALRGTESAQRAGRR
ncbi:ligase-associated DNA damage response endonuclease PdeM [Roseiflexus castenholzii]|jgi:DNA ligase-associated metallophosphoesterase|uniref:Metallophosphoesterase n=1 Tax=Roseiflexus castenholzii (strain DSM 13941 / HLO8) TaxID=383372 RepID=A7NIX7_ROSCS|nr:ligase-associated DNA damage response endonuclease PdeM [Roseiflexus castenholzii]ABU57435.1 metallophosphoesterase [Roseiflexus castenholzii DSM 13941]